MSNPVFMDDQEVREFLGECIHTAFRKGSDDESAHEVWTIIAKKGDMWGDVLTWIVQVLEENGIYILRDEGVTTPVVH